MRSIHTNIQASSPLRLVHHSQTHEHFNLIPSCLHILLPCNAATTSPHFLHELKYATFHETTHPPHFQCGTHFSTCTCISNGLTSYIFYSKHTGETRPITLHIISNSKNLIYMIQCKRCAVTNNIWEKLEKIASTNTADQLTCVPKYPNEPRYQSEHFLTDHQTINDISLIPLEYRKLEKHISSQEATRFSL